MSRPQYSIVAGLQLATPPQTEPIQPSEVREYLRLTPDDDLTVGSVIPAVRKFCETVMRRAFLTQTWTLSLRCWPGRDHLNWPQAFSSQLDQYYKTNFIKLPFSPLQSVTSVTYRTSSGELKTMTPANFAVLSGFTYNVYTTMEPGQIVLPFSGVWPTDILMPGAPIDIVYAVGYTTQQKLMTWEGWHTTRHAMMVLIGDCLENRIPPDGVGQSATVATVLKWLTPFMIYDY